MPRHMNMSLHGCTNIMISKCDRGNANAISITIKGKDAINNFRITMFNLPDKEIKALEKLRIIQEFGTPEKIDEEHTFIETKVG